MRTTRKIVREQHGIETSQSTVFTGEQQLLASFQSTREQLAAFATQLNELVTAHEAISLKAISTLEQNVTKSNERTEQMVSSATSQAFEHIKKSQSAVEMGEEQLLACFRSAREQLTTFGTRLTELEAAHEATSVKAISTLEESVAATNKRTEQMVSSATSQAFDNIQKTQSVVETGEQQLLPSFGSTREQLTAFGTRLAELETAHEATSLKAITTLEQNVATSNERTEKMVLSATSQAFENIKESQSIVETGEQQLLANFQSTQEKLKAFCTRLAELEAAHEATSVKAIASLEQNVATSNEQTEQMVSTATIKAFENIDKSKYIVETGEEQLLASFKSTRQHLTAFGTRLA